MNIPNSSLHPENSGTPGSSPAMSIPDRDSRNPAIAAPPRSPDADRLRRAVTEREKQILRLVCDGLSNSEIATRLSISSETVKSELKRIFRKIEVKNRTQAAVLLVRQGLV